MAYYNLPSSSKFYKLLETLRQDYSYGQISGNLNLDNFTEFLKRHNYNTTYANELLNFINDPSSQIKFNKSESYKFRKMHPVRDVAVKKIGIPVALVSSAIGATMAGIAAANLSGGSLFLGLIPVSATPGVTLAASISTGVIAGLVATPVILGAKRALTKLHYNIWYKNAKKNLEDLNNGVKIEDLSITKLMNKINERTQEILKTKQGSFISAPFRAIKRTILNTMNRNAIHHLEQYSLDLIKLSNDQKNSDNLMMIASMLGYVNSFINRDVKNSIISAMMDNGGLNHTHFIENIDRYAFIKYAVDKVTEENVTSSNFNKILKIAKKLYNTNLKHSTSDKILNDNGNVFSSYPIQLPDFVTNNVNDVAFVDLDKTAKDSKKHNLLKQKAINIFKKISVKNSDNSSKNNISTESDSIPDDYTLKVYSDFFDDDNTVLLKDRIIPKVIKHSTKAINYKGNVVGTKLTVNTNGEKENIEIRYMASKNKIRVKTQGREELVNITDTEIPPYNQMNEILKQITHDKQIEHCKDLYLY